ncbi:MAG: Glu-tRNA(Gln) amidotransferase subunit GatD [Candidatus Aenigmarchaeota archaeon]|nr:Glu-tRNA(Gln) amidotransferase subunit GatD [Candidatus Aenigmarchaeota archaeon]
MYSREIESLLKKNKIRAGDRVVVKKGRQQYEGLLLPRSEAGDSGSLIIKLDSGYNIGIGFKGASLEKIKGGGKGLGKSKEKLLKMDFDKKRPAVSLVTSGGTIVSRVDYKTGGVYAVDDPREFLRTVPELKKVANLSRVVSPVTRMSEDSDWKDWVAIAKAVHKELKKGEGVIVTHGTDTLHYTAAALSFFLQEPGKPVVLLGAQRSSDRGSSDAGMNLLCAAHAALSDIAEVGTCMHSSISDDCCLFIRGTKVKKMNTMRRDAFRPINDLPLAKVFPNGRIEIVNKNHKKRSKKEAKLDVKFEPKVALVKVHPSADPGVLEYHRSKGIRGFVIEGTGLGHVPTKVEKSWIPGIKKLVKDGIPVVVTSQTVYGRVHPSVYANLRTLFQEAKAIPGKDMLSETAFVKLGWVLGHTKDLEEVRSWMEKNVAGEITERSLPETFLY